MSRLVKIHAFGYFLCMGPHVTIIGAGLTGTAVISRLTRVLHEARRADSNEPAISGIRVIERGPECGPGFPHSSRTAFPRHLINMCPWDMSILADNPHDFLEWLETRHEELSESFPMFRPHLDRQMTAPEPCPFVPRGVMGEYLKERFHQARQLARENSVSFEVFQGWECIDLQEGTHRIRLRMKNRQTGHCRTLSTDRVVLTTGHWFEEIPEDMDGHFFPSPWPSRLLQAKVPAGARVAVLGSSLSAVDTVLTLSTPPDYNPQLVNGDTVSFPGHGRRTLVLCSRNGLLPKVRGRMGSYRNVFLTPERLLDRNQADAGIRLQEIGRLLSADLTRAYGRPFPWRDELFPEAAPARYLEKCLLEAEQGDGPQGALLWQTVLHQAFSMARDIYLQLRPRDRIRFDRDLASHFFRFAAPMPIVNARRLKALFASGRLELRALGTDYELQGEHQGPGFVLTWTEAQGSRRQERFDAVVDARGQSKSFSSNQSELARNLLASKTACLEQLDLSASDSQPEAEGLDFTSGGLWIDPDTQRLKRRGPDGRTDCSQVVYAAGPPTRGQILDASMAWSSALAAQRIVQDIMEQPPE